jgi:hypothetical protein
VVALAFVPACFDKPLRPSSATNDADTGPDADTGINVAFVTSTASVMLGTPGFTTVDELDSLCRAKAAEARMPLKGTFVAWISTGSVLAITRLGQAEGWQRPDGQPFVASRSDLARGNILYPLTIDENGDDVRTQPDSFVATDTRPDGTFAGVDCLTQIGSLTFGRPDGGTNSWTSSPGTVTCNSAARLYCFQIDHQNAPPPLVMPGRHAFLTDLQVMGDKGPTFDAECASEASMQGYSSTFLALVGFENALPTDRFPVGPDWQRFDGVRFMTGDKMQIDAPLDMTAKQFYVDEEVWGGASSVFATTAGDGSENCSNWTASGGVARTGRSSRASPTESFGGASSGAACGTVANARRLYCLEQ